jgi:uncharacterized membrane protein YfcA
LAWDANRPIPWQRLLREAAIFVVIGAVAIAFLVKHPKAGDFAGLVIGMIFYVAFVAVLSKFGYQRQSIREARERRRALAAAPTAAAVASRQRPAPTRRTTTGPSQRPNRSNKKRRR